MSNSSANVAVRTGVVSDMAVQRAGPVYSKAQEQLRVENPTVGRRARPQVAGRLGMDELRRQLEESTLDGFIASQTSPPPSWSAFQDPWDSVARVWAVPLSSKQRELSRRA